MKIAFEDIDLEDLFLKGTTNDKKYRRLPQDIVKRYIKVVNYLRAARRIEDLFLIGSLHYAKKEGNLKDVEAVRINGQYRLLFRSSPDGEGIIVNVLLKEKSKHYE